VATLIATNVSHGLPTLTGFTDSFGLEALFLIIAVLGGLLIPARGAQPSSAPVDYELAAETS
jgi:hypothetical protein